MFEPPKILPSSSKLSVLPIELRISILLGLDNLRDLSSLILTSSACYEAFKAAEKDILLSLLLHLLDADGADLKIALRSVYAGRLNVQAPDQLDQVTRFLKDHPEDRSVSKLDLLDLTLDQSKALVRSQQHTAYFIADTSKLMLSRHPVSREEQSMQNDLSAAEKHRLSRSIQRWELWHRLFGPDFGEDGRFHSRPKIKDIDLRIFLDQFQPWEIEELACINDYALRRYSEIFAEIYEWLPADEKADRGGYGSISFVEEIDVGGEFYHLSLDKIVSLGPGTLYKFLNMKSVEDKAKQLRIHLTSWGITFSDIFNFRRKDVLSPPAQSEPSEIPVGYWFAWEWDDIEYSTTRWYYHDCPLGWGYVFWDGERMKEWGIEVDGDLVWPNRGMLYSRSRDEIVGPDPPETPWRR